MNVLFWGPGDFKVSYSNRDTSWNAWNRHSGSFMVDTGIFFTNMKSPSRECWMAFWPLTNSDFPTDQTFHQFDDLHTKSDLTLTELWVVFMDHLQRMWHASRERLPFRTPGFVPLFGTCLCSNCWDQIPRTCHVLTRLFTLNYPFSILLVIQAGYSVVCGLILFGILSQYNAPLGTRGLSRECVLRIPSVS